MIVTNIDVQFVCPACGARGVELPMDYSDESTAKCKACGVELGLWGDIKNAKGELLSSKGQQVLDEALRALDVPKP